MQTISTAEALRQGFGKRTRDEFEAITLDPDLPKVIPVCRPGIEKPSTKPVS